MNSTVWLYLVVSSDEQGYTLPDQRAWAEAEAAGLGATIDPNGVFEGVASGREGARTILLELIDRLRALPKARHPSRILMTRLDRIGRMPLDAIAALNELRKLGVTIRTRVDGDVTFDRVGSMLKPIFDAIQGGLENEVRSDKSRAIFTKRRAQGLLVASKAPYGVRRGGDGRAEPDPETAAIVAEVFERWLAGDAPADILLWLRAAAPPRRSARDEDRLMPMRWDLSYVYKMIRCRTYRDVVVDGETWDRAQERTNPRARPQTRGKHVYPFAGIRCACGARLKARTNEGPMKHRKADGSVVFYERRSRPVWYVCASLRHDDGPRWRSYREDRIETAWIAHLGRLAAAKGAWNVEERPPTAAREAQLLAKRREAIEAKRERIHRAFEDGVYDAPTFRERLAAVNDEAARIGAREAEVREAVAAYHARSLAREQVAAMIAHAGEIYAGGTRAQKAELNAAIFAAFGVPTVNDGYGLTFAEGALSAVV